MTPNAPQPLPTGDFALGLAPPTKPTVSSWPPPQGRRRREHLPPEHATALPSYIVVTVRELWHRIGNMRRAEARVLSLYNWAKVRRGVRARAIAIYWQGVTHEAQCAPNGTGRAADLMAYRAEFAVAA